MSASRDTSDNAPETRRERLAPLIWRRLSLSQYRDSERFGHHRRKVGAESVLPVADFVDALTMYFLDRLPAGVVARIGIDGCRRRARILAACLSGAQCVMRPVWWVGRFGYRVAGGYYWRRPAGAMFHRRTPVGNSQLILGGRVRLWGFAFDGERLISYWQRTAAAPHPVQIFVHLYPPGVQPIAENGAPQRIYKDHDPAVPLAEWPRGRVYEDVVDLRDVPSGDYRVDIGLIDLVRRERFEIQETGESAVNLGWVRLRHVGGAGILPAPYSEGGRQDACPTQDQQGSRPDTDIVRAT